MEKLIRRLLACHQPLFNRQGCQAGHVVQLELGHEVAAVLFDGFDDDEAHLGNGPIGVALPRQLQDLLSRWETRLQAVSEWDPLLWANKPSSTLFSHRQIILILFGKPVKRGLYLQKRGSKQEKENPWIGGVRVVLPRCGIVLDRRGGAMAMMIPAFRLFVGGAVGDGKQWFPWIHMHDLTAAVQFALARDDIHGPLNFCAPQPVRNRNLADTLAEKLNRTVTMPAPLFMVELALGEFGGVLLHSQRAKPVRLLDAGFDFTYPDLNMALSEIMDRKQSSEHLPQAADSTTDTC